MLNNRPESLPGGCCLSQQGIRLRKGLDLSAVGGADCAGRQRRHQRRCSLAPVKPLQLLCRCRPCGAAESSNSNPHLASIQACIWAMLEDWI